ncbi:hypothetical protein AX14_013277 [Amanita brunnescens Koide BX004]|nr:hypothetical protein AX14_013277 [Amanita brunnescens Koide BX004]
MEKIFSTFHNLTEARFQEALPVSLLTYLISRFSIVIEACRNTVSGIPTSSWSSASSACSPVLLPNSGFSSTSVLPASASLLSSSSAPLSSTSFPEITGSSCAPASPLSSLKEWSQQHIRAIFEAGTDEDAVRAIRCTFADKVSASVNGTPLPREGIDALVLAMRNSCGGPVNTSGTNASLQVKWMYGVDVPRDPVTNRDGSFGGVYVIKGIKRMVPGLPNPVDFERHKTVTVKIDSMTSDPKVDSRRITNLVFVASDVRADMQAIM